jgi:hypothetical protein
VLRGSSACTAQGRIASRQIIRGRYGIGNMLISGGTVQL